MFMFGRFKERAQKCSCWRRKKNTAFNHSCRHRHLLLGLMRRRHCRQGSAVIRCGIKCRASAGEKLIGKGDQPVHVFKV